MVSFFGWVCSITIGLGFLSIVSETDFSEISFSPLSAMTSSGLFCSACCNISRGTPRGKPRGKPLPCGKPRGASLIICSGKNRSVGNVSTADTSGEVDSLRSFSSMIPFS